MKKTVFWLVLPMALGAVIASQWKDIIRYFKIEQMDWGQGGHPENVPAGGRVSYPQAEPPSGDTRRGQESPE